jgi:uncharacterized protein YhaN
VENKKIDVLFGVVVIAFLVVTFILIKDFKSQRSNDYKEFKAIVSNIVRMKNSKLKVLSNELAAEQKENQGLKDTLAQTRNALDILSKQLAVPVTAPAGAPAAAK